MTEASMTDAAPAVAPAAPAAPAASTAGPSSASDVDMETVFSCTLYGLGGWDSASKWEKRLRKHNIGFLRVEKQKGKRETEAQLFFESEAQMKQEMETMQTIREAPPPPVLLVAPTNESSESAPARPASPTPQALTKQLFKVRAPTISTRRKRASSPRRDNQQREFRRSAKRMKVELKEGEVGYAEADEAARASEGEDDEAERPSGRDSPTHLVEATINDVVAPLWRKPYSEQLEIKRDEVKQLMRRATMQWKREYKKSFQLPHMTVEDGNTAQPLFCPLAPIVPSPVIDAYRNKCEFSVGFNSANRVTIGHLMGKYTEGTITVESIQDVPHVPQIAKSLSATLNEFIDEQLSELKPYSKIDHSGFWRLVVVRNSAETKQVMMLVQVAGKNHTEEQMEEFKQKLLKHFEQRITQNPDWSAQNEGYTLKALQLQIYDGVSNAAPEGTPATLLYGKEACITERLMGLEFRVSMDAFFQINVPQTNNLYRIAAEFAKLPAEDADAATKANNLLFDVCCGTGTIGLSLANRVGKVIGLELSAAAVEDAQFNAKANGISNAFYYVGKAEDTLATALAEHVGALTAAAQSQLEVTAIVDPPRTGLHADVVRLLRRCPRIHRIVYVSCNPKTLMENLQRFVQPPSKRWTGPPFSVVQAQPVDMFPHTTHCEMVVLLEREKQKPAVKRGQPEIKVFAHQLAGRAGAAAAAAAGSAGATSDRAATVEPTPAQASTPSASPTSTESASITAPSSSPAVASASASADAPSQPAAPVAPTQ